MYFYFTVMDSTDHLIQRIRSEVSSVTEELPSHEETIREQFY